MYSPKAKKHGLGDFLNLEAVDVLLEHHKWFYHIC
jgi:hypothetical protein